MIGISFIQRSQRGFALPTILILSIVLIMILLAAVAAMTTVRQSLVTQQYDRMAKLAAESGVLYATKCLREKQMVIPHVWPTQHSLLTPNKDCDGQIYGALSSYLQDDGQMRTTFEVPRIESHDDTYTIQATGVVELMRKSDKRVYRTYRSTTNARLGNTAIKPKIVFGYLADGWLSNEAGAFFATIDSANVMATTGMNKYGQLGRGLSVGVATTPGTFQLPANVRVDSAYSNFLSQGSDLFAKTTEGQVYGAGLNSSGQLGIGYKSTKESSPKRFLLPNGEKAESVTVHGRVTFVITQSGLIYAAGICDEGVTGTGCTNDVVIPRQITGLPAPTNDLAIPKDIVADASSILMLTKGGAVYGWGRNLHGELGTSDCQPRYRPVRIGSFGNNGQPKIVQVQNDGDTFYLLDDKGSIWASGRNHFGQLGVDRASTFRRCDSMYGDSWSRLLRPTFQKIASFEDANIKTKKIVTDQWTLVALSTDGRVYSLGLNNRGQMGSPAMPISDSRQNYLPVPFSLPFGVKGVDIVHSSLGDDYDADYNNTYVIGDDRRVYGAGSNDVGQLGDGTIGNNSSISDPVVMKVFDGIHFGAREVRTGFGTTIILSDAGGVYTVGNNNTGQLGDGTTQNSSIPEMRKYTNPILNLTYY